MKDMNSISTYLTKHDSLMTAATLISFRGADFANHSDHAAEECMKDIHSSESNNRSEDK